MTSETVATSEDGAQPVGRPALVVLRNGNKFEGRAVVRDGQVIFRGRIRPVLAGRGEIERSWPMHGDVVREVRWLDDAA